MERESKMFNDLNSSFARPNWENSMDQNDPFESALSSMVSSPTASNANVNGGENVVLRELIGRLGSICNSANISSSSPFNGGSANTSCYSTPLNSPPKLNLGNHFLSLPSDPAFAERAARFSCFSNKKLDPPHKILGSHPSTVQENWETPFDSRENSMVSEQIANPRKRKSAQKGKAKQTPPPNISENSESSAKRSKSEESKDGNSQPPEPPKDYIHVRARRGQATDAHSLAERVRREKISERMKVLQDLVPGCHKVTGKAVMLDEIINYVQSLQRQVEFLSMKLATVNPRMEFNMEAAGLMSKEDMFQSPCDNNYPYHSSDNLNSAGRSHTIQLTSIDNFGEAASQVSSFWEDDLHSIVQMGFGARSIQGILPTSQMKVEL